eukprot:TRINITY_DN2_c0_g1_i8.p3 TRINITY_DN2_c0_g1~~TRINITY_DN2_c0_g1_i8.p3  ORF type:complete len:62 (-),score=15.94 TRINITY_DN2_c0_g1_i8:187-372(-)
MFSRYCQKVMADVQAGAKQEEADLEAEVNREQQAVMKKVNAALVEINAKPASKAKVLPKKD